MAGKVGLYHGSGCFLSLTRHGGDTWLLASCTKGLSRR
jgi:hypothetical protein